jgi:translation initiation factor 1
MNLEQLDKADPFACDSDPFQKGTVELEPIHIRVQQRNGRKCITHIQGLSQDTDIDLKKLLKSFKKSFNCNGSIQEHEDYGKVLQMSGDQRSCVKEYLQDKKIIQTKIIIHGAT